jgi:thiamine biosynthesis protein ThiS
MVIKVNGKQEDIGVRTRLSEIIREKNLSPEKIVVEYNLRIVVLAEWPDIQVQEDDRIEIISFVGGG